MESGSRLGIYKIPPSEYRIIFDRGCCVYLQNGSNLHGTVSTIKISEKPNALTLNNINLKYIATIIFFYIAFNSNAQTTSMWSGSGFFLSSDGYIATNNHVVENSINIFVDVFTNGSKKTYKATIVKTDPVNDLAVIKIKDINFKKLSSLPYAFKMMGINVGEKVFAMGYPQIDLQGNEVKVTDGIISSKSGFQNDNKSYQISAPIQHGNSGGPLFDNSGNLIGITSSGLPGSQNVGWAIKVSYLNNLLDLIPSFPSLPSKTAISELHFTEKIKTLSKFVVLIRVTKPNCDLKTPSELFYQINASSSYNDICSLLKSKGDNYRTDGSSSSSTQFFKWVFCKNKEAYIDCWFQDNKLILAMKSFINETCNSSLSEENYKRIKVGMPYTEIKIILQGEGDKIRTDFEPLGDNMTFYKWYDCNNPNLYFEVWFLGGRVHLVKKGDNRDL